MRHIHGEYDATAPQAVVNLSPNGSDPYEINELDTEFLHELNPLKAEAILAIVNLFAVAVVSLNCVSTSVQATVSILVR